MTKPLFLFPRNPDICLNFVLKNSICNKKSVGWSLGLILLCDTMDLTQGLVLTNQVLSTGLCPPPCLQVGSFYVAQGGLAF